MVEQIFKLSRGNEKAVEKVIFDDNLHYLHMVFNKTEGLPEHFSNSNVYMTVIRGILSIGLNDQEIREIGALDCGKRFFTMSLEEQERVLGGFTPAD